MKKILTKEIKKLDELALEVVQELADLKSPNNKDFENCAKKLLEIGMKTIAKQKLLNGVNHEDEKNH